MSVRPPCSRTLRTAPCAPTLGDVPAPRPLQALPLAAVVDAEAVFLRLLADRSTAFWLDAGADASEGWSVLGTGRVEQDPTAVRSVSLDTAAPADDLPFRGGWVGWLSYEGEGAWITVERAIAVDHATGRAFALAAEDEADAWRAEVLTVVPTASAAPPAEPGPNLASARHGVDEYMQLVQECRAAIERGDAYQLCLTTRFTASRPRDPLSVYRRLRAATPAHHGGFIRVGERMLLSASPEQFLEVSAGVARTSPIKGTRPRGADAEEDARLAADLQADPKERAENVMIVDLMRNDLSHVGVPGTVDVERLWQVETYPAVHQLVSTVSVRLREGTTVGDLVDAAFPAGSMTGAPKESAMAILRRLEGARRGVYSGCFGHVGLDGRVDLAMVIRSIVVEHDHAYVGAGGGITWLSKPDAEAAEVSVKARAPLAALGAGLPHEWAALLQSR